MKWTEQIERYWQEMIEDPRLEDEESPNWLLNKKRLHELRGSQIVRVTGDGNFYRSIKHTNDETTVEYRLYVTFLVKQDDFFYHEEEERAHQALFYKGKLIEDSLLEEKEITYETQPSIEVLEEGDVRSERFNYDRRAAVQYAERWWNSYNPTYRAFDVDCTNYVSQCLHAGGAPMRGAPARGKGWWYQNKNWSFSWAVAHSLRWYLSGSTQGLKGKEMEAASELILGDVICYDFEGDGNWNHNTMVVARDKNGMPLVNAHTSNSRHRYWSYEDSSAWTTNCKYKFFRIGE